MKKKILYFIFFYIFFVSIGYSQYYQAIDTTEYEERAALIKEINSNFKSFKKELKKKHKGKIRNELKKTYTRLHNNFIKDINNKKIVFNSEFSNYIDSLTNSIVKSNSDLIKSKLKVFVTRHNSPNALSMGNGFVLINMGLFKYLKTEAQLVSVLTHEIAHQLLKHSEKNIIKNTRLEISKTNKEQVRKIKKKKFNKQSEAFGALKKILLAGSKLNRKQEKEADSLGFILYNNTKYPPKEFINTLSVLIKYDTLPNILLKKSIYKKVFDIPKHPFKESWLKIENFEVYNYKVFKEKINKDSLKSHPELASRIKLLKKKFTKELSVYKELQPNIVFKKLKEIANNEDISNLSYLEKYGLSIYLTLSKLEKDPENKYFKKWIGKNFVKLYDAKKKYQFNRYVNRLKPKEQDESYQQFLSFLWNLNLKDIKVISDYYQ